MESKIISVKKIISSIKNNPSEGMIIADHTLKIMATNRTAEKLLGYETDELKGKDLNEILTDDAREEFKFIYDSVLFPVKNDALEPVSSIFLKKSGQDLPVVFELFKYDHPQQGKLLIGKFKEVTEQKDLIDKIKLAEERFEDIFTNHPIPMFISRSADGKIMQVNKRLAELLNFRPDEIIGKTTSELNLFVSPERGSELHMLIAGENPVTDFKIDLYKKDKSIVAVLLTTGRVACKENNCYLTSIVDISENKKYKRKIKDFNTKIISENYSRNLKLKKVLEREKELNILKTRIVTTASHEFRTPLATIMSSLHLLEKYVGSENSNQIKHINRIKKAAEGLTTILNDLLTLENIEQSINHDNESQVELKPFIEHLLSEIKEDLKRGQTIVLSYQGESNILVDINILSMILLNLISNASKFSNESKPINLAISVTKKQLTIKVKDYGIGIPKEEQTLIFNAFYRSSITEAISGTGLGLSLVKKYLDLVGGKISFKSTEGSGSEFTVHVPLKS